MGSEYLITLTRTTVTEESADEQKTNVAMAVKDNDDDGNSLTRLNATDAPFYNRLFGTGQLTLDPAAEPVFWRSSL
jgi:hypothetical protein